MIWKRGWTHEKKGWDDFFSFLIDLCISLLPPPSPWVLPIFPRSKSGIWTHANSGRSGRSSERLWVLFAGAPPVDVSTALPGLIHASCCDDNYCWNCYHLRGPPGNILSILVLFDVGMYPSREVRLETGSFMVFRYYFCTLSKVKIMFSIIF